MKWWDRWLKNTDNGVEQEPMLRAWIEDWTPPIGTRTRSPGRWVAEETWPSANIAKKAWYLNADGCLSNGAGAARDLKLQSPLNVGQAGGEWMGAGCPGENATDQRIDDALSLTFDTPPLSSALEILGAPELDLWIASDKPVAQIGVRLIDLAPDGSALRVSYQVLNLTHRDSHAEPTPLEPGKRYRVPVKLNDCGHRFAVGHRIRVSISQRLLAADLAGAGMGDPEDRGGGEQAFAAGPGCSAGTTARILLPSRKPRGSRRRPN